MMTRRTIAISILATTFVITAQADEPWGQVPPLPTSCYSEGDSFETAAISATESLRDQEARQQEVNLAIEEQYREVDIMEKQQRMVAFMMEHPEKAQQYMEAQQQGAQQVQEQTPELVERQQQLDAEMRDLMAAYAGDLQQAMAAVEAQQHALNTTLEQTCNEGLLAKSVALRAEENRVYDGVCANWWKGGPFHDWLARYKQFQIEQAANWAEFAATSKLNYEVIGVAADQYRAPEEYKGPIEYLRRAMEIFVQRRFGPVSEELGTCEVRHG